MRQGFGDRFISRGFCMSVPHNDVMAATNTVAVVAERPLQERFNAARAQTERLLENLSAEDCALQSRPGSATVKWHLAHTTWFFETHVLQALIPGYQPFHPQFGRVFDASNGPAQRGVLSRPSLAEVLVYRRHVNGRIAALLDAGAPAAWPMVECGVQHEQRHQELLLADLQHLFSCNPLQPVYAPAPCAVEPAPVLYKWMAQPDGVHRLGYAGSGFCFDHELPRHRIFLEAYEIALRPVTNAEYADFIADGGYSRQELWLAEGWELKNAHGWQAPLYWQREGAAWLAFGLHGLRAPAATAPVCHVSYFEADAYARWAGARLPSEAEWECFAAQQPLAGHFLEDGVFESQPAGAVAATQIYGDVWEWTHSPSQPYPGYRAGHVGTGGYSEKFKSNQYVLRGGSCVTPRSHIRASYRHFITLAERWQFSGIRLARDLD